MKTLVLSIHVSFYTKGIVLVFKPFKFDNGIGLHLMNLGIGISYNIEKITPPLEI